MITQGNRHYQCNNSECGIVYDDFTDLEEDKEQNCYICPNCHSNDFILFIPTDVSITTITRQMVGEMN